MPDKIHDAIQQRHLNSLQAEQLLISRQLEKLTNSLKTVVNETKKSEKTKVEEKVNTDPKPVESDNFLLTIASNTSEILKFLTNKTSNKDDNKISELLASQTDVNKELVDQSKNAIAKSAKQIELVSTNNSKLQQLIKPAAQESHTTTRKAHTEATGAPIAKTNTKELETLLKPIIAELSNLKGAIAKNAKTVVTGQTTQAKMLTSENNKIEANKKRNIITSNKKPIETKKEVIKTQKTKQSSFSMKEFMRGFAKIVSTLFNPVAIVTALVARFLPYIMLAVAFFMGFWKKLSPTIKEKIEYYGSIAKTIAIGVGIIFVAIKGVIALVKTLSFIRHAFGMFTLTKKQTQDTALFALQTAHESTSFLKDLAKIALEVMHDVILFTAEMAKIVLGTALDVAAFALKAAGVGLIILLVSGLVLSMMSVFGLIGNSMESGVDKMENDFKSVLSTTMNNISAMCTKISDSIDTLIHGADVSANTPAAIISEDGQRTGRDGNHVTTDVFTAYMDKILDQFRMLPFAGNFNPMSLTPGTQFGGIIARAVTNSAKLVNNEMERSVTINNSDIPSSSKESRPVANSGILKEIIKHIDTVNKSVNDIKASVDALKPKTNIFNPTKMTKLFGSVTGD